MTPGLATAADNQETALWLLDSCVADDPGRQTFCAGYISGYFEGVKVAEAAGKRRVTCLPEQGISTDEAVGLLYKHLDLHPADVSASARVILFVATTGAFPCK